MNARTSDRVSAIAGRYVNVDPDDILAMTATPELRKDLAADIRSLAASALRQDEVSGLRKFIRKVFA